MFATGKPVAQVIQWLGINEKTYYRWRTKYGGLKSEEAKLLQVLELENTRLKRLIANQAIENAILKEANDFLGKPRRTARKRLVVKHVPRATQMRTTDGVPCSESTSIDATLHASNRVR
ncbi:MAG: hypothetical protein EXS04_05050 [Phycisphaerales bacterium]|nr:hypothetical protein [Phycisphaerales bacterium]